MPEMDGIQMTQIIRQSILKSNLSKYQSTFHLSRCVIWAITAMNENEIENMLSDDILDGIYVKPLTQQKLKDLI